MEKKKIPTPRMAAAWQKAASDLKITFVSPFPIEYKGRTIYCTGYLQDFGNPKGTVILGLYDSDVDCDAINEGGYYLSRLNPLVYEKYSRDVFMETLNDWGWFGNPNEAPAWFSGAIGRHG